MRKPAPGLRWRYCRDYSRIGAAARPYHIDPLIEHKISHAIADMGIDVITENVAAVSGAGVYDELNAVTQWSYPNRIFKAAYFVGNSTYPKLHLVQLTSFGCGPDAFILDEVGSNVFNRLHFMVENCKKQMENQQKSETEIATYLNHRKEAIKEVIFKGIEI